MRLRMFLFYQTKKPREALQAHRGIAYEANALTPQDPEAALLIERGFLRD